MGPRPPCGSRRARRRGAPHRSRFRRCATRPRPCSAGGSILRTTPLVRAVAACAAAVETALDQAGFSPALSSGGRSNCEPGALRAVLDRPDAQSDIRVAPTLSDAAFFHTGGLPTSIESAAVVQRREQVDCLLAATLRGIGMLGQDADLAVSGHIWYPAGSHMGWHTNARVPGSGSTHGGRPARSVLLPMARPCMRDDRDQLGHAARSSPVPAGRGSTSGTASGPVRLATPSATGRCAPDAGSARWMEHRAAPPRARRQRSRYPVSPGYCLRLLDPSDAQDIDCWLEVHNTAYGRRWMRPTGRPGCWRTPTSRCWRRSWSNTTASSWRQLLSPDGEATPRSGPTTTSRSCRSTSDGAGKRPRRHQGPSARRPGLLQTRSQTHLHRGLDAAHFRGGFVPLYRRHPWHSPDVVVARAGLRARPALETASTVAGGAPGQVRVLVYIDNLEIGGGQLAAVDLRILIARGHDALLASAPGPSWRWRRT